MLQHLVSATHLVFNRAESFVQISSWLVFHAVGVDPRSNRGPHSLIASWLMRRSSSVEHTWMATESRSLAYLFMLDFRHRGFVPAVNT